MARISSADLHAQLQSTPGLLLIDARSEESRARGGWIAGSIRVPDVSALRSIPTTRSRFTAIVRMTRRRP
jgi:hypothetical protein